MGTRFSGEQSADVAALVERYIEGVRPIGKLLLRTTYLQASVGGSAGATARESYDLGVGGFEDLESIEIISPVGTLSATIMAICCHDDNPNLYTATTVGAGTVTTAIPPEYFANGQNLFGVKIAIPDDVTFRYITIVDSGGSTGTNCNILGLRLNLRDTLQSALIPNQVDLVSIANAP